MYQPDGLNSRPAFCKPSVVIKQHGLTQTGQADILA